MMVHLQVYQVQLKMFKCTMLKVLKYIDLYKNGTVVHIK